MQAGAMKMKCMADGGLVGAIKGMMGMRPAETVTEKYARQDAARAAKAPAAAATPAPAPQSAISDYAGMGAMQRREKEQGLKDGGPVKGPGTGTSDSIPRKVHPGTYILPADSSKTVKGLGARKMADGGKVPVRLSNGETQINPDMVHKIGVKVLDMVKNMTHKTAPKMGAKAGAIRKMADGGKGYYQGGEVEREKLIAQIPGTTAAPSVAAQPQISSTELGRNVSNTISALPGAAPALGAIRGLAGASSMLPSAAGIVSKVAPVAPYAPVAGGVAALNAAGSAQPAPIPTAPAPVSAPAPSMPGTPAAVASGAGATPSTGPAVTLGTETATYGGVPGVSKFSTISGKTLYSNVTTPGDNETLMARGPTSAQNQGAMDNIQARQDAADASRASTAQYKQQEADAAATNAWGGFNTGQPQTARSMILSQLAGKKLTGKGARVLSDLDRTDATTATATAANKLAQDKLGVERTTATADARLKGAQATTAEGVIAAQARLAAAKTPEEIKAATENLRVVQGKEHANRYTVIPGGQTIVDGQIVREPATVLDNQSGKIVPTGAQGAPAALPPKDKLVKGQTYPTPRGPAKWDGAQFIPA